jgi:DNA-3-methyladenine glycosylase I
VTDERRAVERGPDGARRCAWSNATAEYIAYHDREWGRPVVDDRRLFEKLCLESFQSGLSWLTILRKRDAFRAAFRDFDVERVARFGARDVARCLGDAGIVRNRAKIEAAIANARATVRVQEQHGSLAALLWSFEPSRRARKVPRRWADVPAVTPESTAMAKALKSAGYVFLGPTTCYAAMQSLGIVNDHFAGCVARTEAERERTGLTRPVANRH